MGVFWNQKESRGVWKNFIFPPLISSRTGNFPFPEYLYSLFSELYIVYPFSNQCFQLINEMVTLIIIWGFNQSKLLNYPFFFQCYSHSYCFRIWRSISSFYITLLRIQSKRLQRTIVTRIIFCFETTNILIKFLFKYTQGFHFGGRGWVQRGGLGQ